MTPSAVAAGKRNRLLVVDDHPIVRQGMALLINREADLEVCGEADESGTALTAIERLHPDIVIVDLSLNGPDGMDLIKAIRARWATLPILVLSMHDELTYADRALRAGANGYIMKQEATTRVLTAVRRILGGDVYLSDRAASRVVQQFMRGSARDKSPIADLTDRELEIFRLIGDGHRTRQIAEELHLSIKTVESYQAHIKEKLGLRGARELVQRAILWSVSQQSS